MCRPCRDYIGHLGALLAVPGGYVGPFGSYVGPFGGHVETMLGAFWLSWRIQGAMFGHWTLCWDYARQLEALLVVFEGYAGAFGVYVGIMLRSLVP
jgi:hypothetical protein